MNNYSHKTCKASCYTHNNYFFGQIDTFLKIISTCVLYGGLVHSPTNNTVKHATFWPTLQSSSLNEHKKRMWRCKSDG